MATDVSRPAAPTIATRRQPVAPRRPPPYSKTPSGTSSSALLTSSPEGGTSLGHKPAAIRSITGDAARNSNGNSVAETRSSSQNKNRVRFQLSGKVPLRRQSQLRPLSHSRRREASVGRDHETAGDPSERCRTSTSAAATKRRNPARHWPPVRNRRAENSSCPTANSCHRRGRRRFDLEARYADGGSLAVTRRPMSAAAGLGAGSRVARARVA
jgi:hypothetical protein